MNKSQLVNKIAISICISKGEVSRVLDAMTSSVIESLQKGGYVSLIGFGTFSVKTRPSRRIKNPKTGKEIFIEASRVPIFRSGKKLRESVNLNV